MKYLFSQVLREAFGLWKQRFYGQGKFISKSPEMMAQHRFEVSLLKVSVSQCSHEMKIPNAQPFGGKLRTESRTFCMRSISEK